MAHGPHTYQSINLPYSPSTGPIIEPIPTRMQTFQLNAALTGAVATTVARFDGPLQNLGTRPAADWITQTTTANAGTTWKISLRGVYSVECFFLAFGNVDAEIAIGLDSGAFAAADLNASALSCIAHGGLSQTGIFPGTAAFPIGISGTIVVTQAMADDANLGVVRYHMSDFAGAPPTATSFDLNQIGVKIERLTDVS